MRRNPSRFALAAVSLLCIAVLVACNCAPTLRYVTIAPLTATVYNGPGTATGCGTQQYTAVSYYSDGSQKDATSLVAWTSSNSSLASIGTTGLASATGTNVGTVTITGSTAGASQSATLTVNYLNALTVTPAPSSTIISNVPGTTQQFTLTGSFNNADGSTSTTDFTTAAVWSVSNGVTSADGTTNSNSFVSIGTATGLLTVLTPATEGAPNFSGGTTVTATLCGGSASTYASIGVIGPVALVITPASPTIPVGGTQLFTATETYSDGTTGHPVSGTLAWTSSATATATIDPVTGVATGVAAGGPVTITAQETTPTSPTTTEIVQGTASLTVATPVARFAYVTNVNDSSVQVFADNSGVLVPTGKFFVGSGGVQEIVFGPNGNAYTVGTDPASTITTWSINPTTGAPIAVLGTAAGSTGSGNTRIAIDPTGHYLYAVTDATGEVRSFTITQYGANAGQLVQTGDITISGGAPSDVKISPNSMYLYVVDSGNDQVVGYDIGTSGVLTQMTGTPVTTANSPFLAAMDPTGSYLYVPNGGVVDAYAISATDGTLSPVTGEPFTVTGATNLLGAAVDPADKFLYVVDSPVTSSPGKLGTVFSYAITSGALASTATSSATTGYLPTGVAVDTTGTQVLVDNNVSDTITSYSSSAGTLARTGAVETGLAPQYVTFYNGTAAPVLAPGEVFAANPGIAPAGSTVSAYSIASGVLTADANSPYATIQGGSAISASSLTNLVAVSSPTGGSTGLDAFTFNPSVSPTLAQVTGAPFATTGGQHVISDATGNFVYVIDTTDGEVNGYHYSGGTLMPIAGSPWAVPGGITGAAIDPAGAYLYTFNSTGVSQWQIDPQGSGSIGSSPTSTLAAAGNWTDGTVSADGNWLAVLDPTAKTVQTVAITNSGLVAGLTLALTGTPSAINFDPQGIYLLVTDATAGTISAYSFSPLSSPQFVATGTPIHSADRRWHCRQARVRSYRRIPVRSFVRQRKRFYAGSWAGRRLLGGRQHRDARIHRSHRLAVRGWHGHQRCRGSGHDPVITGKERQRSFS